MKQRGALLRGTPRNVALCIQELDAGRSILVDGKQDPPMAVLIGEKQQVRKRLVALRPTPHSEARHRDSALVIDVHARTVGVGNTDAARRNDQTTRLAVRTEQLDVCSLTVPLGSQPDAVRAGAQGVGANDPRELRGYRFG